MSSSWASSSSLMSGRGGGDRQDESGSESWGPPPPIAVAAVVVNINILTGTGAGYVTPYPELTWIHKKVLKDVDVELSWVDAIEKAFGRKISSEDFYVTKAFGGPIKHLMTSPIRLAIGNYKNAMNVYNFAIKKSNQKRGRRARKAKEGGRAAIGGGSGGGNAKNRSIMEAIKKMNQEDQGAPTLASAPVAIAKPESESSAEMPTLLPALEKSMLESFLEEPNYEKDEMSLFGDEWQWPPLSPPPAPVDVNDEMEAMDIGDTKHEDEDDGSSQVDCEERGIVYEKDLRDKLVDKVGKLSAGQLSVMRNEILKLKASDSSSGGGRNRSKFIGWTIDCPGAVTLLRELLDV